MNTRNAQHHPATNKKRRPAVTHLWFAEGRRAPCGRLPRLTTAAAVGDAYTAKARHITCVACREIARAVLEANRPQGPEAFGEELERHAGNVRHLLDEHVVRIKQAIRRARAKGGR